MKGMRGQKGFTLIELIVVIVILGILAATALPKFVNLGGDARLSVMKGVEGSMRAANSLIYASAAVTVPNPLGACGAGQVVTVPGIAAPGTVLTCFGYALNIAQLQLVMDLSPAPSAAGPFNIAGQAIQATAAQVPGNCQITYAPPGGANLPPTYTESPPPVGPLTAAGCL